MMTSVMVSIVIWHTFDLLPAKMLTQHVNEYAAQHGVEVRLETGMDVVQSLMDLELLSDPAGDRKGAPDAVIGPSDLIGLADQIGLEPVAEGKLPLTDPPLQYADGVTDLVRYRNRYWGYPLLSGNHLLLYHHKSAQPPALLSPAKTAPADRVGLQPGEPYVFLMMVLGQLRPDIKTVSAADMTEEMLTRALRDYKTLMASDMVASPCDYQCITRDFFQGKWQYAVNGDWALADAAKQLPNFRLAPLPSYNGVRWRSPCAVFALMPTRSIRNKPDKAAFLRGLAMHLASVRPQQDWFAATGRIPVNRVVLQGLKAKAGENDRVLFAELERAACLVPDQRISAMWPALRKGIRLYSSGARSAEDTARYVLRLMN
jgi:ABC-type glycerol-3-phosphate transport system substrate-binding protein